MGTAQFSVGAFADSAHEYLLKQWLLSSRVESKAKDLCTHDATSPSIVADFTNACLTDLQTVSSILKHLLYLSPTRHLLYVTDIEISTLVPSRTFEHLSCFLPGLLTLGAATLSSTGDLTESDRQLHQWAAEGLANTCWVTYADHVSGLGPDEMRFSREDYVFDDPDTRAYVEKVDEAKMTEGLVMGKWMHHVRQWEAAGKPGGVPPGVKDPEPVVKGERDYTMSKTGYFLRPEVRVIVMFLCVIMVYQLVLTLAPDG